LEDRFCQKFILQQLTPDSYTRASWCATHNQCKPACTLENTERKNAHKEKEFASTTLRKRASQGKTLTLLWWRL